KLTNLPRGIEQYLEIRRGMAAAAGSGPLDLGERDRVAVEKQEGLSSQEERELKKQLNALERKISKLDPKIGKIHADMAAAAEAMDTGKLTDLDAQLKALESEREELEMEWLELGEKLEG